MRFHVVGKLHHLQRRFGSLTCVSSQGNKSVVITNATRKVASILYIDYIPSAERYK